MITLNSITVIWPSSDVWMLFQLQLSSP